MCSDHNGLKLETNLKEKLKTHSNTWRLNSMLLNNEWVNNEIKEEIKQFQERNENEPTTTQNLWDRTKAALRGKFIAIQFYLKKIGKFQINNQTLHLQKLENDNKQSPEQVEGRIIKVRAELNVIETKKKLLKGSINPGAGSLKR